MSETKHGGLHQIKKWRAGKALWPTNPINITTNEAQLSRVKSGCTCHHYSVHASPPLYKHDPLEVTSPTTITTNVASKRRKIGHKFRRCIASLFDGHAAFDKKLIFPFFSHTISKSWKRLVSNESFTINNEFREREMAIYFACFFLRAVFCVPYLCELLNN